MCMEPDFALSCRKRVKQSKYIPVREVAMSTLETARGGQG